MYKDRFHLNAETHQRKGDTVITVNVDIMLHSCESDEVVRIPANRVYAIMNDPTKPDRTLIRCHFCSRPTGSYVQYSVKESPDEVLQYVEEGARIEEDPLKYASLMFNE
jgi:hypothetical protein